MKTLHILIIFIIVATIQLFVPAKMILDQENILDTGTVYKFRTQPLDPSDPFRGKYITLYYDINSVKVTDSSFVENKKLYLYIKKDSLGFAIVDQVTKTPINSENDYLILDKFWYYNKSEELNFILPFNRFYMEETKAKPAEDAYRKAQRDSLPNNIYGLVYIKDGEGVLNDVIINDMSIAKYVEE